jgi:hypothetical protein
MGCGRGRLRRMDASHDNARYLPRSSDRSGAILQATYGDQPLPEAPDRPLRRPRSRIVRSLDQIRPASPVLGSVALLAGRWAIGGFAGSQSPWCRKIRSNSRGGPAMNVTRASATSAPLAKVAQSIEPGFVPSVGLAWQPSCVMRTNLSSPKKVARLCRSRGDEKDVMVVTSA